MDALIGFAILGGIILVIMVLTSLKDRAVSGVSGSINRRLRSGTHQEGLGYADTIYFFATEAPEDLILASLREDVRAEERRAALLSSTHLVHCGSGRIGWAHGNAMHQLWTANAAIATITPHDGPDERGVVLAFDDLTLAEGVVAGVAAMRALKHDVVGALQQVDASVVEREIVGG